MNSWQRGSSYTSLCTSLSFPIPTVPLSYPVKEYFVLKEADVLKKKNNEAPTFLPPPVPHIKPYTLFFFLPFFAKVHLLQPSLPPSYLVSLIGPSLLPLPWFSSWFGVVNSSSKGSCSQTFNISFGIQVGSCCHLKNACSC